MPQRIQTGFRSPDPEFDGDDYEDEPRPKRKSRKPRQLLILLLLGVVLACTWMYLNKDDRLLHMFTRTRAAAESKLKRCGVETKNGKGVKTCRCVIYAEDKDCGMH